ncbi:hypothetical protein [Apilactobacillus xinyiensis]|uniref:hypothetical protein n=1 Tax=Apilactobacillus xinyiensis TaxID=2841032 RepID=UPI00201084F2|nr:hypothetical protein [Apilactobacillus xinyiensis]MCL0330556.1 hypothetical protein [Apilactobacillus xinyiensis]
MEQYEPYSHPRWTKAYVGELVGKTPLTAKQKNQEKEFMKQFEQGMKDGSFFKRDNISKNEKPYSHPRWNVTQAGKVIKQEKLTEEERKADFEVERQFLKQFNAKPIER